MRIHCARGIAAAAVVLLLCLPLRCFAQATVVDQIAGTIQDSSGAAVPNAQIKALQTDTGFTRSTVSTSDGSYVLTNLPIGPYRIEVSAPGFKTSRQEGVVLQVNTNPRINAVLQVGAVSQQIEVRSNAVMAETQTTGISQVINDQSVVDLPLNGRQPTQLILLSRRRGDSSRERPRQQQKLSFLNDNRDRRRAGQRHHLPHGRRRSQ